MPERGDFIRAVIAAPDDDAPRLIFADWLEENGESELGEFIRVQVAITAMEADDPRHGDEPCALCHSTLPPLDCRWAALRRRERELLKGGKATWQLCPSWLSEWLAVLPGKCPVSHHTPPMVTVGKGDGVIGPPKEYHLHRGFVEAVTCTAEDWLLYADDILQVQPVREVTLTTWPESWGPYNTRPTAEEWLHSRWPSVKTWHLLPAEHAPDIQRLADVIDGGR